MTADGDGLEILSKGLEIFEANRANGLDNALATHHISLIFCDHSVLCEIFFFFFFFTAFCDFCLIYILHGGGRGMERTVKVVAGTKRENPTILPFLAPKSKDMQ